MDTKIFLQGFDSKNSSNTSEGLNVQFKGRRKLLPLNDVAKVISQYDQYREEREKCNIIRLTCQVNPVCSNVLFNRITEITKNEGSSGVSFINYGIYGLNMPSQPNKCEYEEYGSEGTYDKGKLFSGIVYKKKDMGFWSGNTMYYQGYDNDLKDADAYQTIYASTQFITHSTSSTVSNNVKHPTNAIRDTQLSNNETNFKYHCGIDIFNNHLLRSNTFKTVCKMPEGYTASAYTDNYGGFNTIVDLMRDVRGYKVIEKISFPSTAPILNHAKIIPLHLYEYDDIYTFNECIKKRLISKFNGWVGFENKSKIKSYLNFSESDEMKIERPLMYMAGGDFVDMYPGRELYSFNPIYNPYRKRVEKNWNYCITYPSSSYTPSNDGEPFSDIIECGNGINSLKALYFDENTRADNGTTQLVIYSIAKHGLSKGDYVNIYKTYEAVKWWVYDVNGNRISEYFDNKKDAENELKRLKGDASAGDCGDNTQVQPSNVASSSTSELISVKIIDNAEVSEIVDDYIFTVFNSDVQISNNWVNLTIKELNGKTPLTANGKTYTLSENKGYFTKDDGKYHYFVINDSYVNIDDTAQRISYKKVVNGIECDYYIRIFSKLPNFKFADDDTSNEYQLYKNDEAVIHKYQDVKYDFESHASRLAFAKNIYTDDVSEVVFTDDINISNLHDNLGRPLTNIYLTIIKNNKGYKEWYGYDFESWNEGQISGQTVEYSHAFGKITCGVKTCDESAVDDRINSINKITNIGDFVSGYLISGYVGGRNRSYLAENGSSVAISDNEVWYDTDKHFWGDLSYYDNYNAVEGHIEYVMHRFNTAQRESKNSKSSKYFEKYNYDEITNDDYDITYPFNIKMFMSDYVCNDKKEGYYYNPHYEIPIKSFGKLNTMMPDFLSIRQFSRLEEPNTYKFTTLEQHFLSVGDKAILYDTVQDRYYTLVTISNDDNYRSFTCKVYDEESGKVSDRGITYVTENTSERQYNTITDISTSKKAGSLTVYDFRLFKIDNLEAPSYCKILKDGTCRIIWRNVINNGFNESDKTLEEYPFTNGAFYVNKRVDLYVRRQDPYNIYELYSNDDIEGNEMDIYSQDNYFKDADIEC